MDFTGTFLLVLECSLLLFSAPVLAKAKRKPSIKCERKLGKLTIRVKPGITPNNGGDFKIKPLATYRISNQRKCLISCLFHRSHVCRSIAQMKAGKSMICLFYSESHIEHPERFKEQKGTIFTELICDYGSMMISGGPTVSDAGDERHGSFGKYIVNVYKKPILGVLKKTLNITNETWSETANDFDLSEAACVTEAMPLMTRGDALQFKRPDKGQIVCKIFGGLKNA